MRQSILTIGSLSVLFIGAAFAAEPVAAPDHSLLDLAAPVRAAILKEAATKDVARIELGSEDGRPVYYVRIRQPGLDERMTVARDGAVLALRDFKDLNDALASTRDGTEKAWEKTKEGAKSAWEATKDTVDRAMKSFGSDELTLNQVPEKPRAALERAAAGNRLTDIHYKSASGQAYYEATIKPSSGASSTVKVGEDGSVLVQ